MKTNNTNCPNCGSPLIKKSGKFGNFLACPKYPNCKYTEKLVYTKQEVKPIESVKFEYTEEQINFFNALEKYKR